MSNKMSLDGGYIGSLDHAISNLRVGQIQGRAQGYQEGVDDGYQRGYHNGWSEAVAVGNANIEKQMEYTRQHVAEKEALAIKLAELEAIISKQSKEYGEQLWQYNRCLVFMNTMRSVIEDLTKNDCPQSEMIRYLFKEKYAANVDLEIQRGAIKIRPDQDGEFSKRLPKTHKFIVDLLGDRNGKR